MKNLRVECYSGYRGEETPRRFWPDKKSNEKDPNGEDRSHASPIQVIEVLDRWMGPDHRYFKVLGHDGSVCVLRLNVDTWNWELYRAFLA